MVDPLRMEKKEENLKLFYTAGSWYEITLNPNDQYQCLDSAPEERVQDVWNNCAPKIRQYLKCEFELYTEVSEPQHMNVAGGFPRVHFHGKIKLSNVTVFKCALHYLHMFDIQINAYDPEYWDEYMTKSVPQITADIGKRYVKMTHVDELPIGIPMADDNFFRPRRKTKIVHAKQGRAQRV